MQDITLTDLTLSEQVPPVLHVDVTVDDTKEKANLGFDLIELTSGEIEFAISSEEHGVLQSYAPRDGLAIVIRLLEHQQYYVAMTYHGVPWGNGPGTAYGIGNADPSDIMDAMAGSNPMPDVASDADIVKRQFLSEQDLSVLEDIKTKLKGAEDD